MTNEQRAIYRDAVERVRNLEPFTGAEVDALEAIPGVTVEIRWGVRKGIVLGKLSYLSPDLR